MNAWIHESMDPGIQVFMNTWIHARMPKRFEDWGLWQSLESDRTSTSALSG